MPKIKWNSERFLSLSAMFISFLTLIFFIYQTNLMRKQNYLAILPYLAISTSNNTPEHTFELNLINHGVGPAIIESVTLIHDGKRYDLAEFENEMMLFLKENIPALAPLEKVSSSTLDKGMAIPANTTYNIFKVADSPEDHQLIVETLEQMLENGFDYEIVYRSIGNERWRIYHNSEGPEKL